MKTKYQIERFVNSIDDSSAIPTSIADGIRKTVEDFVGRYEKLDEEKASKKSHPEKWSQKEILGHIIDSAANNHQRFVRVQYEISDKFISYDQNKWVNIQKYGLSTWRDLLFLWKSYNLHLANVIENMPLDCLKVTGTLGSYGNVSIGYIIVDYLGHMQHHLHQIEQM